MYTIMETIEFSYGHRLLRYRGNCAHLHGHNGRVEIVLGRESLDAQSMVADFSEIGLAVRGFIDEHLDHRMLLHKDDPLVAVLQQHDEPLFLMETDPTAEEIARLIYDHAVAQGFPVREVRLWETASSMASFSRPQG
jgi:6-pyruvoyltetrahydropterin/6-carboxytetrahydropterin synthase